METEKRLLALVVDFVIMALDCATASLDTMELLASTKTLW
jgi:alpha-D-ribose 1-methylphosphonate 5-triphosphate synthase subunit PhnL